MDEPKLEMKTLTISGREDQIVEPCVNSWACRSESPEESSLCDKEQFIKVMEQVVSTSQLLEPIIEFVLDDINLGIADINYGIEEALEKILLDGILDEATTIDTTIGSPPIVQPVLHTDIVDQSREIPDKIAVTRLMLAIYFYYYVTRMLGVHIETYKQGSDKYITENLPRKLRPLGRG